MGNEEYAYASDRSLNGSCDWDVPEILKDSTNELRDIGPKERAASFCRIKIHRREPLR